MSATQRTELVVFQKATTTENDYGEAIQTWTNYVTRRAKVRFGTAQEKREAAQEGGAQSATFECVRSSELETVALKDRIVYLSSNWDIVETAPLDKASIRFTATRVL